LIAFWFHSLRLLISFSLLRPPSDLIIFSFFRSLFSSLDSLIILLSDIFEVLMITPTFSIISSIDWFIFLFHFSVSTLLRGRFHASLFYYYFFPFFAFAGCWFSFRCRRFFDFAAALMPIISQLSLLSLLFLLLRFSLHYFAIFRFRCFWFSHYHFHWFSFFHYFHYFEITRASSFSSFHWFSPIW